MKVAKSIFRISSPLITLILGRDRGIQTSAHQSFWLCPRDQLMPRKQLPPENNARVADQSTGRRINIQQVKKPVQLQSQLHGSTIIRASRGADCTAKNGKILPSVAPPRSRWLEHRRSGPTGYHALCGQKRMGLGHRRIIVEGFAPVDPMAVSGEPGGKLMVHDLSPLTWVGAQRCAATLAVAETGVARCKGGQAGGGSPGLHGMK